MEYEDERIENRGLPLAVFGFVANVDVKLG